MEKIITVECWNVLARGRRAWLSTHLKACADLLRSGREESWVKVTSVACLKDSTCRRVVGEMRSHDTRDYLTRLDGCEHGPRWCADKQRLAERLRDRVRIGVASGHE